MPSWWKRSKSAFHRSSVTPSSSASTPASPARASTSRVQPGGGRRGGDEDLGLLAAPPPKLQRQRKLRHVGGIDAALGDLTLAGEHGRRSSSSPPKQRGRASAASEAVGIPGSTPISRSASSREVVQPPRSASSPVLLPLPSLRPADLDAQDPPGVAADGWGAPSEAEDPLGHARRASLVRFSVASVQYQQRSKKRVQSGLEMTLRCYVMQVLDLVCAIDAASKVSSSVYPLFLLPSLNSYTLEI